MELRDSHISPEDPLALYGPISQSSRPGRVSAEIQAGFLHPIDLVSETAGVASSR